MCKRLGEYPHVILWKVHGLSLASIIRQKTAQKSTRNPETTCRPSVMCMTVVAQMEITIPRFIPFASSWSRTAKEQHVGHQCVHLQVIMTVKDRGQAEKRKVMWISIGLFAAVHTYFGLKSDRRTAVNICFWLLETS